MEILDKVRKNLKWLEADYGNGLVEQIANLPGGAETMSPAILQTAYEKFLQQKIHLEKGENIYIKANLNNPDDRDLHIVRDASGEYHIFLIIGNMRADGTEFDNVEPHQGKDKQCNFVFEISRLPIRSYAQLVFKEEYNQNDQEAYNTSDNENELKIKRILGVYAPMDLFNDNKRIQYAPRFASDLSHFVTQEYDDKVKLSPNDNMEISLTKLLVFKQIVDQVAALSNIGIAHRDLKPENIYIGRNHVGEIIVIIGDTDTASKFCSDAIFVGTSQYLAPENIWRIMQIAPHISSDFLEKVTEDLRCKSLFYATHNNFKNKNLPPEECSYDSFKVTGAEDVYALGIILCEFFKNCRMPLFSKNGIVNNDNIREFTETINSIELLQKMLAEDPEQRIGIKELQHELDIMIKKASEFKQSKHSQVQVRIDQEVIKMLILAIKDNAANEDEQLKIINNYLKGLESPKDNQLGFYPKQIFKMRLLLKTLKDELNSVYANPEKIAKLEVEIKGLHNSMMAAGDLSLGFKHTCGKFDPKPKNAQTLDRHLS